MSNFRPQNVDLVPSAIYDEFKARLDAKLPPFCFLGSSILVRGTGPLFLRASDDEVGVNEALDNEHCARTAKAKVLLLGHC